MVCPEGLSLVPAKLKHDANSLALPSSCRVLHHKPLCASLLESAEH
jgi:hypothetical protein